MGHFFYGEAQFAGDEMAFRDSSNRGLYGLQEGIQSSDGGSGQGKGRSGQSSATTRPTHVCSSAGVRLLVV